MPTEQVGRGVKMLYGAVPGTQPLTAAVLKQPVKPTASRLAAITGKLGLRKCAS